MRGWARGVVLEWLPLALILWMYDLLRGAADGLLFATNVTPQIDAEKLLFFGVVPSVWLQEKLWHGSLDLRWYDYAAWGVYVSYFLAVYVLAAALLVLRARPVSPLRRLRLAPCAHGLRDLRALPGGAALDGEPAGGDRSRDPLHRAHLGPHPDHRRALALRPRDAIREPGGRGAVAARRVHAPDLDVPLAVRAALGQAAARPLSACDGVALCRTRPSTTWWTYSSAGSTRSSRSGSSIASPTGAPRMYGDSPPTSVISPNEAYRLGRPRRFRRTGACRPGLGRLQGEDLGRDADAHRQRPRREGRAPAQERDARNAAGRRRRERIGRPLLRPQAVLAHRRRRGRRQRRGHDQRQVRRLHEPGEHEDPRRPRQRQADGRRGRRGLHRRPRRGHGVREGRRRRVPLESRKRQRQGRRRGRTRRRCP